EKTDLMVGFFSPADWSSAQTSSLHSTESYTYCNFLCTKAVIDLHLVSLTVTLCRATAMREQPLRRLYKGLQQLASAQRYLFTPADMRALLPDLSDAAYRALLSRAANDSTLIRLCRGLYLYTPAKPNQGLVLYHAAARLRAN